MYIAERSIDELELLVNGYLTALDVHGIDEGVPDLGRHFCTWLRLRTGWSLSAGWAYAIRQHSRGPEDALKDFFDLLYAYRCLKPVPREHAILGPRHLPTGRRSKVGRDQLMPPPSRIDIVEYQPEGLLFLRHAYGNRFEFGDILLDEQRNAPGTTADAKRWAADEFGIEAELWTPTREPPVPPTQ